MTRRATGTTGFVPVPPRRCPAALAIALLFAATVAACSRSALAPLPPGGVPGTYVLLTEGGSTLPFNVDSSTYMDRLIADTLLLDAVGGGSEIVVMQHVFANDSTAAPTRFVWPMVYRLRSDTLQFDYLCPLGYFCIELPRPRGWFLPDGRLLVDTFDSSGKAEPSLLRTYRRIAQPPSLQRGTPAR